MHERSGPSAVLLASAVMGFGYIAIREFFECLAVDIVTELAGEAVGTRARS